VGDRAAVEDVVTADRRFWSGRRVLLTGHTGFKGAWLAHWLEVLGADVTGLALAPEDGPSLWRETAPHRSLRSIIGDVRDAAVVGAAVASRPQVAIHMAAQSLLPRGYRDPVGTFSTNVLGTVTFLDQLRRIDGLECVLVVTSDKVYEAGGRDGGRCDTDPLGGADPYSASKASQEHAVRAFAASFFRPRGVPVVTARAGNVVGGGDWAADRLVPDLWRAAQARAPLALRHPQATRPWQHVLDCLNGYLRYAEETAKRALDSGLGPEWPLHLNFGPSARATRTVAEIVSALAAHLDLDTGWVHAPGAYPPEEPELSVDASVARERLGWVPALDHDETMRWTGEWYRGFARGVPAHVLCERQIAAFTARASV